MFPKKILVVEDSELLHRMYDLIFQQQRAAGTVVLHSFNGREALTTLANHPDVELIILDINMPVMSGLEFLSFCRRERVFNDIPVIIVSTEGKEDDTLRGLQNGARGYITKPFKPTELHRLIERIFSVETATARTSMVAPV
jgi:two-component system, chemotaxis family, chemotaxis protein CheY